MWMGRSMNSSESSSISSQPYGSSFSGGGDTRSRSDSWKSKIVENSQWIGGKVYEYGAKLAGRSTHSNIPDRPQNDGRANWMADIRRNFGPNENSQDQWANNKPSSSGYQNEFPEGRPNSYNDYKYTDSGKIDVSKAAKHLVYSDDSETESSKKKKRMKSRSKKNRGRKNDNEKKSRYDNDMPSKAKNKSKKKPIESDSESSSSSEDACEESSDQEIKKKETKKQHKKKEISSESSSSEEESEDSSEEEIIKKSKKKSKPKSTCNTDSSSKYGFALNVAAIQENDGSVAKQPDSPNETKSGKKKKSPTKSKKVHRKKDCEKENVMLLDLLDAQPSCLEPCLVLKEAKEETKITTLATDQVDTLSELAGLHFEETLYNDSTGKALNEDETSSKSTTSLSSGLQIPGSNLVDLNCLIGKPKKTSENTGSKTLNELQKMQSNQYPPCSMPMPVSGSMHPHAMSVQHSQLIFHHQQQQYLQAQQMQYGGVKQSHPMQAPLNYPNQQPQMGNPTN